MIDTQSDRHAWRVKPQSPRVEEKLRSIWPEQWEEIEVPRRIAGERLTVAVKVTVRTGESPSSPVNAETTLATA